MILADTPYVFDAMEAVFRAGTLSLYTKHPLTRNAQDLNETCFETSFLKEAIQE